jgi:hypothetical protein
MGFDTARLWRSRFEAAVEEQQIKGGDIWVARELLATAPKESMYWCENSESGVSWASISAYFRRLKYSDSTKSFLLLDRASPFPQ